MEFPNQTPNEFLQEFNAGIPRLHVRAPGRINLIGEHTDYNGGRVLPFAIEAAIGISVRESRPKPGSAFEGLSFSIQSDLDKRVFSISSKEILNLLGLIPIGASDEAILAFVPPQLQHTWAAYVLGALWTLVSHNASARDALSKNAHLLIRISSTIPAGAGVSSSAALTTGLLTAFSHILDVKPDRDTIARYAMSIEHRFVGTKCGLMDQLAVLFSHAGYFTHIDFRDFPQHGRYGIDNIVANPALSAYDLVVLNTGVKHSLAHSPYNERRNSCARALQLLNAYTGRPNASLGAYAEPNAFAACFGAQANQEAVKARLANEILRKEPDSGVLAKRAAHAICENLRVERAIRAIETGDLLRLDEAMLGSHQSLAQDYEVSCEELDLLCRLARDTAASLAAQATGSAPAILGPRLTGGGFGGSTIQFVRSDLTEKFMAAILDRGNLYHKTFQAEAGANMVKASEGLTFSLD